MGVKEQNNGRPNISNANGGAKQSYAIFKVRDFAPKYTSITPTLHTFLKTKRNGLMNRWMDGCMYRWVDSWTDEAYAPFNPEGSHNDVSTSTDRAVTQG